MCSQKFRKIYRKHLCQSLFFNKVSGLMPATLFKKWLWRRCFPVNFVKLLRTRFCRTSLNDCFYFSQEEWLENCFPMNAGSYLIALRWWLDFLLMYWIIWSGLWLRLLRFNVKSGFLSVAFFDLDSTTVSKRKSLHIFCRFFFILSIALYHFCF